MYASFWKLFFRVRPSEDCSLTLDAFRTPTSPRCWYRMKKKQIVSQLPIWYHWEYGFSLTHLGRTVCSMVARTTIAKTKVHTSSTRGHRFSFFRIGLGNRGQSLLIPVMKGRWLTNHGLIVLTSKRKRWVMMRESRCWCRIDVYIDGEELFYVVVR